MTTCSASVNVIGVKQMQAIVLSLILVLGSVTESSAAPTIQGNDRGGTVAWSAPLSTSISAACVQFSVVGLCIWIVCTNFGCDVSTTIKYGHFNPETFVEVTNPDGIDRTEAPKRSDTHNRDHNNLISQDAFAMGHPLTGQIYCSSHSSAGSPYFWSQLDIPAWRWGGLDTFTLAATIPGIQEIGAWPFNTWGALYPRTGWTLQSSEPKAAGVIAQRTGDIITRSGEPHIYNAISGNRIFVDNNKINWAPAQGLTENTNQYGWFQLIFPKMEQQCVLFGHNDVLALTDWGGGRVSFGGDYAYNLYRPYTCCEIDDGALITIDFTPFPVVVITN